MTDRRVSFDVTILLCLLLSCVILQNRSLPPPPSRQSHIYIHTSRTYVFFSVRNVSMYVCSTCICLSISLICPPVHPHPFVYLSIYPSAYLSDFLKSIEQSKCTQVYIHFASWSHVDFAHRIKNRNRLTFGLLWYKNTRYLNFCLCVNLCLTSPITVGQL